MLLVLIAAAAIEFATCRVFGTPAAERPVTKAQLEHAVCHCGGGSGAVGLASALSALAARFTRRTGVAVERRIGRDLPPLGEDADLVLYRVAREALTNVARHAESVHVMLQLARAGDAIVLTVDDDGRGIPPYVGSEARGITGMGERALLVHGRLTIGAAPSGGTRVRIEP
jgi:two-component system sensor histidine kinase UhpB